MCTLSSMAAAPAALLRQLHLTLGSCSMFWYGALEVMLPFIAIVTLIWSFFSWFCFLYQMSVHLSCVTCTVHMDSRNQTRAVTCASVMKSQVRCNVDLVQAPIPPHSTVSGTLPPFYRFRLWCNMYHGFVEVEIYCHRYKNVFRHIS